MSNRSELTRRGLLAAAGALGFSIKARADDNPIFDDSKPTRGIAIPSAQRMKEIDAAPLIKKTVNKVFNDSPLINEPNDMCFTPKGTLLLLDQDQQPGDGRPNQIFEVVPTTGKVIRTIQTEGHHSSGITIGDDGSYWITSTEPPAGEYFPLTLKVDPNTGKTLEKFVPPGWGFYGTNAIIRPPGQTAPAGRGDGEGVGRGGGEGAIGARAGFGNGANPTGSGGHGIKWAGKGTGQYWIAVPSSGHIMLIEAATNKIVRALPAPVNRTHGLAVDGNYLWSCAADYYSIQKLDILNGNIVGNIQLDKTKDPSLHGLAIKDGQLWYCDANKGWVCNLT